MDWTKIFAEMDCTIYGDFVKTLPVGESDENARRMVAAVIAELGPPELSRLWSVNEWATEYTMYHLVITHNGLNQEEFGTPQTFKYALGILFHPGLVEPSGQHYLLWNDPPEPEIEPEPEPQPDPEPEVEPEPSPEPTPEPTPEELEMPPPPVADPDPTTAP